ncbi:alkene reductase [Nocardiopsis sp. L17-MgMaSL7]|uniref:alkene reductase n=1 Tax=Nocardiopsis sp. L17-MgMaSL7 TaxID=1938893 RepID=UPI000D71881D|nr:alkene reductase [Nocardiopsis sp. L17-MgMaSL7]
MDTTKNHRQPLLDTYELGRLRLPNRVVMAPMTRLRADRDGVPGALMATYYAQRASAGLIISEGAAPSVEGQQYLTEPGLYSEAQVEGWRRVTDAVHAEGGRIFAQIMHAGRGGHPANRPDGGTPVAPSVVPRTDPVHTLDGKAAPVAPRELTLREIAGTVASYADAARAAVRSGFDGVEIHGANGYLPHQFLADNTNRRTDAYGGGTSGRIRFPVEVTEAVADAVGADRVGLRLSPGNRQFEMVERDPAPVYRELLRQVAPLGLAYLHVTDDPAHPALAEARRDWHGTLVGNTGEHRATTQEGAAALIAGGHADLVSVGRPYISNPDVVERLAAGVPWSVIREKDFHYASGPRGYVDYPRHDRDNAHLVAPLT